ncbi:MAG: endolytic transglycosylase MltG [Chitinophagaceae bacterium]|nr:endolytic transglycosylase MltG [Chitinophagaceae bacterium]
MKKLLLILTIILLLAGGVFALLLLGSAKGFEGNMKYLYIPTGEERKEKIIELLQKDSLVKHTGIFSLVADRADYWEQIKPGKYKISAGDNILDIVRMLKNGRQSPVNLTITKIRTKENLAALIGRKFECDSAAVMQFLLNQDTLSKFALDSNTIMTVVFPDTYTYFWNTTPSRIFAKLYDKYQYFWTAEKKALAQAHGLSPQTAYTLASIVEEETNKNDEKGNIASVYLNRMRTGMRLGADPTVKYALRDFSLRRIYHKHLQVESPYNTYRVAGLPPGPICSPSETTITAVLNAPQTDYIYFVANMDAPGSHTFTTNYEDHLKYARTYQKALDSIIKARQQSNQLKQ